MALLVLLNNFMHDFSAAGWTFGTIALYALLKKFPSDWPDQAASLLRMAVVWMRWCFAGIIIFGIGRTAAYKQYEWSEAAGDAQITLLIVKHVFFTAVLVLGIVYCRKAGKVIRKTS